MSQPTQIKGLGYSGEFIVIDNSAAPSFPTLNFTKESIGYDATAPGAIAQGQNTFGNGTIPDAAVSPILAPVIVQKKSGSSTGSVASLAVVFASNNVAGNSIVVVCGVGNGTAPTISDSQTNSYSSVTQVANGTAFNVAIFIATNVKAGANTVTVNNGGTAASIAAEIYELSGVLQVSPVDSSATNQGTATTTSPAVSVNPTQINDYTFAAFGLGTAAQTITVVAPYTNDSGQLNPTTPAGLFSFASASAILSALGVSSPSATVGVAEPWVVAVASLKAGSQSNTVKTGFVAVNNPALAPGVRIFFKSPA